MRTYRDQMVVDARVGKRIEGCTVTGSTDQSDKRSNWDGFKSSDARTAPVTKHERVERDLRNAFRF